MPEQKISTPFLVPHRSCMTFLVRGDFCTLLCTVLHSILPVFMGSAVRTRPGPGCLWHASPMGNRAHNLEVLSIGLCKASTSTCFNWLSETRVRPNLCPLQDSNPAPPLISTEYDLKAEGPLSESLRGVQHEVGQSAVLWTAVGTGIRGPAVRTPSRVLVPQ